MLELVVFVSGAMVMVLEMVGARVMAPYFGTSVIVWTSLIGIVMACLAAGAWFGGRLADKTLSTRTLGNILAGAGAGCGITALTHSLIGEFISGATSNIYLAAVVAAVFIFALPATLFGMVTPYTIRLRLADLATSGATVGRIYALSTAGSIIGTFLGGFVLVSWFGSTVILFGTGAVMLAASIMVRPKNLMLRAALLLGFPVAAFGSASYSNWQANQGMPEPIETPYNCIRLMEGRTYDSRMVRLMATDPGMHQSGMYIDNPAELYAAYTRFYALGPLFAPASKNVLMLGGGGYSVPKWLLAGYSGLNSESLRLDVVEIDPAMTEVAGKYFGLPEDRRMSIYHRDARQFLNSDAQNGNYDLIFVDVFNSHYSVPFHMGTVEAAKAMRQAVNNDGVMIMNIISAVSGKGGSLFQGIYGAIREAFPEVHVFAVSDKVNMETVQNVMVVAFPRPRPDLAPLINGDNTHLSLNMRNMLAMRLKGGITTEVPPLRDDFAPVERYTQAAREVN